MTLRTYIIVSVIAFLAAAMWLLPHPDTMIGWGNIFLAFTTVAGCLFLLAIVYALKRLFWAIVSRLER